ncbi:MAG: formylglycine-generating enzyme family protein [Planctomycetota bacterium]
MVTFPKRNLRAGAVLCGIGMMVLAGCGSREPVAGNPAGPAGKLGVEAGGEAVDSTDPDRKSFRNSIGMTLVWIPPGEFMMGSPDNEPGRGEDEGPQHKVKITKGFYMGATEVTQAQWKAVMGDNPSNFKGDDLPVEQVSWNDCQVFLKKFSDKEGKTYRLPTEAEWEYACRAGTTTRFCFGDDDGGLGAYAWFYGNSGNQTHAVGTKKSNAFGLYDMHGNVWEWCQDRFGAYPSGDVTDPTGATSGSDRVLRSGSWFGTPEFCRSACRVRGDPAIRSNICGFRVVAVFAGP